jgi:hypothetical protein
MSTTPQNAASVKQQRDSVYRELKTVNKRKKPDRYYQLLAKFTELAEQYCTISKGMQS